jgi:1-aminocyclopropane-1-carboxylate deaminase/D-cysteine desulfhydrase-like pyridoxal-dependent ACC family enzyme
MECLHLAARTEGLLLDPVYTAKALAGLRNAIRSGEIGSESTVVFVHTGGNPALFAYANDLAWAGEYVTRVVAASDQRLL